MAGRFSSSTRLMISRISVAQQMFGGTRQKDSGCPDSTCAGSRRTALVATTPRPPALMRASSSSPTSTTCPIPIEPPAWRGSGDGLPAREMGYECTIYTSIRDIVALAEQVPRASYLRYPCVSPGWDNSPRRSQWAHIFRGATPELYGSWLAAAFQRSTIECSRREPSICQRLE